jgi:hypothetical protein
MAENLKRQNTAPRLKYEANTQQLALFLTTLVFAGQGTKPFCCKNSSNYKKIPYLL